MNRAAKVAAAKRTLSLFTGKTDLEDPNARDGSTPIPVSRPPGVPLLKWSSSKVDGTCWYSTNARRGTDYEIRKVAAGGDKPYRVAGLRGGFKMVGTIQEAAALCDADNVKRPA